jgi:hypothetical protein
MAKLQSTSTVRTGGCHCGEVRYELVGAVANATLCHCSLCRATTGAPAVAWCSVEANNFRFTRGLPRSYRSTPMGTRTFCPTCGTQLTFREGNESGIDITTASLDEPDAYAIAPRDQTFVRSELSWMGTVHALPRFSTTRYKEN